MTHFVDTPVNEHEPKQLSLIPRLARKRSQHEMIQDHKAPPLTPIKETVVRNGVTYYALEVYQFQYGSRLPTNVNNPRMAASRLSTTSEPRKPDFRVERRYSDFTKLRLQIKLWTCPNAQFACNYCYDFSHYIRFKLRQPRMLTSFSQSVEKRKGILQDFITDFVELAQNPLKNAVHRCEAHRHVPIVLESFLRD
ncbi:unnamed protein product [Peronospora destructor]|uniref:PX domain-containing protein n=1 Tax=Peronospora destructor TaxID=86335 RepID=A0AAV0UNX5_9STRA|nr:unnamed protein product [Peronospora destructor]